MTEARPLREELKQLDDVVIPAAKFVELPNLGHYSYRHVENPGKPTILLLHGLGTTGAINWFRAFVPLAKHFEVLAPDMRGHGRSLRDLQFTFSFEDCADDLAAFLTAIGKDKVIVVGYSMGGAITQHLWQRHPEKISGIVFTATGYRSAIAGKPVEHLANPALRLALAGSRILERMRRVPIESDIRQPRPMSSGILPPRDMLRLDLRRMSIKTVIESAKEVTSFDTKHILATIAVPTTVLVTLRDNTFSAKHQNRMAKHIRGAQTQPHDDGHLACIRKGYSLALTQACVDIAQRINPSDQQARKLEAKTPEELA
jgi:pimeloyl-ACP methyl ester carboxylesterase